MIRAEPRLFDPGWLYRPDHRRVHPRCRPRAQIQAGPLGLYLLYLLLGFRGAAAHRPAPWREGLLSLSYVALRLGRGLGRRCPAGR